jgi:hypothetical protein
LCISSSLFKLVAHQKWAGASLALCPPPPMPLRLRIRGARPLLRSTGDLLRHYLPSRCRQDGTCWAAALWAIRDVVTPLKASKALSLSFLHGVCTPVGWLYLVTGPDPVLRQHAQATASKHQQRAANTINLGNDTNYVRRAGDFLPDVLKS